MHPVPDHPSPPVPPGTPLVREEAGTLSLCFDDGIVQSRSLPAEPTRLMLEYTRLMMGFLLFQPEPERIAMIGLGGGSLARYCTRKLPDADFTAIEISPEVIALRPEFGVPADGPRFRVLCDDGAEFVRRAGEPLDVLLVDGFDHQGQPASLCSAAFYDACHDRLAAGGVLVVNRYAEPAAHAGGVDHLREVFAGRIVVVKVDDCENEIVFAETAPAFPPPFDVLVTRLRALEAVHPVGLDATVRKIVATRKGRRSSTG